MQTITPSFRHLLATLLLGLVMAAGIAVLAEPEAAWLGFAVAAMYAHGGARRACGARVTSRFRR